MEQLKEKENSKEKILDGLKNLRFNFSDDVPENIVRGGGADFKVRKNWWSGVIGSIDLLIHLGYLPDDISNEAKIFIEEFTNGSFNSRLTTAEDINKANVLIDKILGLQN